MIPIPQRPRSGFPWIGLMVAIVLVAGLIAYWIGGTHGMLLAAIYYGVVALPIALAITLLSVFRRGFTRSQHDETPN
jgi:membrane protein implicated in regulation of membrane protease activity